jgi:hypothetical protein
MKAVKELINGHSGMAISWNNDGPIMMEIENCLKLELKDEVQKYQQYFQALDKK